MPSSREAGPDRRAYADAIVDGFRPSCAALGVLFVVFAGWHAVEFPFPISRVMVPLALATAALGAGVYALLSRRSLRSDEAHPVAAVLVTATYLNCVVQLVLTHDPQLTVNVLLLVIAIGVCLVDPYWAAGLTGGIVVSWVVAIALQGPPDQLSRTVADLLIALIVATMGNLLRRRTLERLLEAQARLRALSECCDLTGLLNRRGFLSAAEQQMSTGRPVTMWFIDVDDLKQVNDRDGHDAGDVLLRGVATALEEVFADAVVARLSGDEFAVVHAAATPDELAERQRRLDDRLALDGVYRGRPVQVSTGTATSHAGQPLSELLSAADAAMYVVKAAKRAVRGGRRPDAEPVSP